MTRFGRKNKTFLLSGDTAVLIHDQCAWSGPSEDYYWVKPKNIIIPRGSVIIFLEIKYDPAGEYWDIIWQGKLWHINSTSVNDWYHYE